MTVILVIHILVSIVLVGVVLMQRSEGGALGVGGGGGGGAGLMSGRGAAGALVRTTIIFGAIFFITSLVLTTITARHLGDTRTDVERALDEEFGGDPLEGNGLDILNDPTAPLLDDTPTTNLSPAPSTETETETEAPALDMSSDPLDANVPSETDTSAGETSNETVDDPQ